MKGDLPGQGYITSGGDWKTGRYTIIAATLQYLRKIKWRGYGGLKGRERGNRRKYWGGGELVAVLASPCMFLLVSSNIKDKENK